MDARDEAVRNAALEEAARAIEPSSGLSEDGTLLIRKGQAAIRALKDAAALSPARVAEGETELTGELIVGNGHFHAGVKLSTVQACIDRHIARQTEQESTRLRDEFIQSLAPESPAKEQPGEVAEMVRRLRDAESSQTCSARTAGEARMETWQLLRQAAALLAKFGQGWIPVGERLPKDDTDVWIWEYGRAVLIRHCSPERFTIERGVTHWQPAFIPPPPERP